jgi:hypothetical protein
MINRLAGFLEFHPAACNFSPVGLVFERLLEKLPCEFGRGDTARATASSCLARSSSISTLKPSAMSQS